MQLRGVVKCPKCGAVYHRALYDFDYISCTTSGCGQDFIKCTGQPWPKNSEPEELAATDNQHTQHAIAALRSALSCHPVNLDLTDAIVASFEKELQQHAGA